MNRHWEQFIDYVPWLAEPHATTVVGASRPPGAWAPASSEFDQLFPEIHRLLREAFVTSLVIDGAQYELYTWLRRDDASCGWLSPLPSGNPPSLLHPHHRVLLTSFGGIVERSNEPTWWILNHNDALTEREARHDATFIRDYAWAFENTSVETIIPVEQFYSIARELNGNTTLCHRVSGEVVLFAPDHAFDYVEPFPGCPDYTLYRLRGAPCFHDWVNTVARQWRMAMEGPQ